MERQVTGIRFTKVRVSVCGVVFALLTVFGMLFAARFLPHDHRGSDQAACVMNQRNIQQAVRSYASLHELKVGDAIGWSKIVGFGQFIEKVPECPVHGVNAYSYSQTVPAIGVLGAPCKDPAHQPSNIDDW